MDQEMLFHLALEKPVGERSAFLEGACGGDPDLRQRVEVLLRAHENPASFLEPRTPGLEPDPSLDPPILLLPAGTVIGRYKLLEPIGEGGYGVVFMAEQTSPVQRKVALKIIKAGMDTRQVIARFEAERQALALMDHPNIAKVFDAGTTESGRPYFVMELVKGIPITKYCDEHRLEPRQRLELFMQVCQAVQHAHQKGIIHRDLKPSNVIVALYDGKPVPKVIDFGVAKATGQQLTEKTMFTGFGDVIGTLEYMSPEQAEVNQLDVDTRSDIYSLGVLLYELLTGTTPLERKRVMKAGLLEMLRVVREEEPPKPSTRLSTSDGLPSIAANRGLEPKKLSALVHGELDWIVMKALEKDRGRRYETASGFAMDVQRYLSDDTVQACPPSAGYRFRKFARRNKRSLISAALLALVLLLGSVVSTWQAVRATTAEALARTRLESEKRSRQEADASRRDAERQTAIANHERDAARRHLHAAQLNLAAAAAERGDPGTTIRILESQRADGDAGLRGFGWHYLWAVCHDGHQLTLRGHSDSVRSVKFVKDTRLLVSGSTDGTVKLWDTATASVRFTLTPGKVSCTAVSPDGSVIAAGSADGTVNLWNATTAALMNSSHRHQSEVQCVAFSPDGKLIASGDALKQAFLKSVGEIVICETATGREVARHPEAAKSIAFSPDGATLAVTEGWGGLRLLDVSNWKLRRHLPNWLPVVDLAFSPDGKSVISGNHEGEVKLWDVATGEPRTTFRSRDVGRVSCVAFSADGTRVACGRADGTIDLWEISSGCLRSRAIGSSIRSVAFSADGTSLASGSDDGTIILWDAKLTPEPRASDAHATRIWSLTFSPDGRTLASASEDVIKLWDVVTGQVRATVNAGADYAAFSPDGRMLASAGGSIRLWDAATAQPLGVFGTNNAYSVAFSPDGKSLASSGGDAIVRIWDVAAKSQRAALAGHSDFVWSVDYSADGKMLVSAGQTGGAKIWDATSGRLLRSIPEAAYFAKFSPDGATVETTRLSTEGHDVLIWDLATSTTRATLPAGVNGVGRNFAFSQNGSSLVGARYDGSIREIDTATGDELVVLPSDGGRCWAIAFSSNGRTVVSGSWTGKVRFWRAASEQEVMQQGLELKSGHDVSTQPDKHEP